MDRLLKAAPPLLTFSCRTVVGERAVWLQPQANYNMEALREKAEQLYNAKRNRKGRLP